MYITPGGVVTHDPRPPLSPLILSDPEASTSTFTRPPLSSVRSRVCYFLVVSHTTHTISFFKSGFCRIFSLNPTFPPHSQPVQFSSRYLVMSVSLRPPFRSSKSLTVRSLPPSSPTVKSFLERSTRHDVQPSTSHPSPVPVLWSLLCRHC